VPTKSSDDGLNRRTSQHMFAILQRDCLGLFIELIMQYTMIVKSYENEMITLFLFYQPLDII